MSNRSDKSPMSAAHNAIEFVTRLERAAMRDGVKLAQAREIVARRVGVSPGTIESIRRGRVKRLAHDIFEKLRAALERQLEREIEAAAHDLAMVRASGARVDAAAIFEAEAALERARSVIREIEK